MNYIHITKENIDFEHICCAMSGKQSMAKKVSAPVTTYALFRDGQFLTQGILSDKKFLTLADVSDCVAGNKQNATGG